MSRVYDYPDYYDIALSFRNITEEVDVFEQCIERFSRIPVRSVLELGCGNCPHMEELVRRRYEYVGIDLSDQMLDYSRAKATRLGIDVELVSANMTAFELDRQVDFALVLVGSLFAGNTTELVSHFESVARALRTGGLYFLDWCITFEPFLETDEGISWDLERDGVTVRTTNTWSAVSRAEQLYQECIVFEVNDRSKSVRIEGSDVRRVLYPQEFLLLLKDMGLFEFVGWWNLWDIDQPLDRVVKVDRPIAVIRRL
jgi:SAM-dependent methyltransferase